MINGTCRALAWHIVSVLRFTVARFFREATGQIQKKVLKIPKGFDRAGVSEKHDDRYFVSPLQRGE